MPLSSQAFGKRQDLTPFFWRIVIGHDEVMKQAEDAGAVIVKPAQNTFWGGYAGYFQDPDGHLWEIVWNPQWAELEQRQIAGYQAQPIKPGEFDALDNERAWGKP